MLLIVSVGDRSIQQSRLNTREEATAAIENPTEEPLDFFVFESSIRMRCPYVFVLLVAHQQSFPRSSKPLVCMPAEKGDVSHIAE